VSASRTRPTDQRLLRAPWPGTPKPTCASSASPKPGFAGGLRDHGRALSTAPRMSTRPSSSSREASRWNCVWATAPAHKGQRHCPSRPDCDLAGSVERALAVERNLGFSFGRKGQRLVLDDGAVNMEFGITYKGQRWDPRERRHRPPEGR
jgi:hypothetical protein